ncbi:MAG TPA: HlyD family secretion protein [Steroidobacteraceae bacterium]|nr:HlyD family secretion protein [Steroidobacteraceae bacterium]
MSVVIEDKGDRMDAPSRASDTAAPENPVAEPHESQEAPVRSLRERLRLPLMIGAPLIGGVVALYFYMASVGYESTDDAYLRAAQVSISPNVSGRVIEVDVHDNQPVRQGETLIRLDERPFRIAVEDARARVANARLQIESLKATYWQHMADLRSAQSALEYRRREYERQTHLLASGISPESLVERTLDARNQAQQNVVSDQQQINATLANLGGDPNIPADHHPTVQEAQAQLDRALLNLSYTTIAAPIDGIVTRVEELQAGDYINAATPAFALVSTRDVWVEANFKEVQLTHMRPGQSATVRVDAYPGQIIRAIVVSISPGTGSQFSLLPPENATGNWVKVVQRLPVRLRLEDSIPVQSGLSALVTVDTRYRHGLFGAAGTHDALNARAVQ